VTNVPQLANWLTDEGVAYLNNCRDDKLLPEQAKRLLCDGYMCFYQSPGVSVIKTFFLVTDSLFDSVLAKPFQSRGMTVVRHCKPPPLPAIVKLG
jgi:hypothetical protein